MCRLVVITFDHQDATGPNQDHNWKRGDVVAIMEDGVSPGLAVENNPGFRIVEVPGVPRDKYQNILSSGGEPAFPDPLDPKPVSDPIRKRMHAFDIDTVEAEAGVITDKQPITINEAKLVAVVEVKPELVSDEIEVPVKP